MAGQASGKRYLSVAAAIKAAIVTGDYAPGQRLPSERDLAFRFGVSRPTVREAMIHLEALAVVAVHHGSGAYVHGADLEPPAVTVAPLDLNEARALLEAEVCALLARLITAPQLIELEALVESMAGPRPLEAWTFHAALGGMTGNLALISALGVLRQLDVAPTSPSNLDGYRAIVQALGRRDSDAARRAMRQLFHGFSQDLLDREERAALSRVTATVQAHRQALAARGRI